MNRNANWGKRSCGFTLTEILVVFAVVAALAAIAIPAYQNYVVRSRVAEGFEFADAARIQVILRRMEGGYAAISKGFDTLEKPAGHVVSLRWVAVTNANPQGDTVIGYLMPTMNLAGLGVRDVFALEHLGNGSWRCVNAAVAAGHSMLSQNQALEDKYLPALCRSGGGMMAPHPNAPAGCPPGTQSAQIPDANGKIQQVCQSTATNPQPTLQPSLQPQAQPQAQPHIQPLAQPQLRPQLAPVQQPVVQCPVGQDCTQKDPKCPAGQEYFAGGTFRQRDDTKSIDRGEFAWSTPLNVEAGCIAKCQPGYAFNPKDTKACGIAPATGVHLCRGPKFICERAHAPDGDCPASMPYAANFVENLLDGSRYVTRGCITQQEAYDAVMKNNPPVCKTYSVDTLEAAHFRCTFPCLGDGCNDETVPKGGVVEWEPGKTAADLPKGYPRGASR